MNKLTAQRIKKYWTQDTLAKTNEQGLHKKQASYTYSLFKTIIDAKPELDNGYDNISKGFNRWFITIRSA